MRSTARAYGVRAPPASRRGAAREAHRSSATDLEPLGAADEHFEEPLGILQQLACHPMARCTWIAVHKIVNSQARLVSGMRRVSGPRTAHAFLRCGRVKQAGRSAFVPLCYGVCCPLACYGGVRYPMARRAASHVLHQGAFGSPDVASALELVQLIFQLLLGAGRRLQRLACARLRRTLPVSRTKSLRAHDRACGCRRNPRLHGPCVNVPSCSLRRHPNRAIGRPQRRSVHA